MSSKSSIAEKVDPADRLVALRYSSNPAVAGLFETPEPGVHVERDSVQVVEGRGFTGDHAEKSFWRGAYVPGREVSACSIEVLLHIGAEPAAVGDNLITRGIDLQSLRPGQRLEIGDVLLARSDRPHRPCATFRDRTSEAAFELAAHGYRGALFIVLRGGTISTGDPIAVHADETI